MSNITVHHGDSRDVLKTLPDNSVDSIVTDPPYALVSIVKRFGGKKAAPAKSEGASGVYKRASAGFMGQGWDTGEVAHDVAFWAECLRVLKPGGHVVAFSATRTQHRQTCAIEDAGFEIRDMLAWLYGSGFPKSHDVSKGIDKAAGLTREVVSAGKAVKRMIPGADQAKDGWEKANGREYVPTKTAAASAASAAWEGWGTALKPALEPICLARKPLQGTVVANALKWGTGALNIDASRIEGGDGGQREAEPSASRRYTDSGSINFAALPGPRGGDARGRWPANVIHDGSPEVTEAFPVTASGKMRAGTRRAAQETAGSVVYGVYGGDAATADTYGDEGSAARFFYSAKADADDRLGSKHPTVKPVDLMVWLVRLVTPPHGVVLDPFAGSGSTGMAAMRAGFDAILIERDPGFYADIQRKLAWARGEGGLTVQEKARARPLKAEPSHPLFYDPSE